MITSGVRRNVRANSLDEGQAIAIALASGFVAALAGAEPTSSAWADRVLVFLTIAVATWASASAAWWAVAAAAGVAAVAAIDPLLTVIGATGFVGGLWVGVRRRDLGTVRCVIGGIALNVLIRLELEGFFGASAVVGTVVGCLLFAVGLRRRPRRFRRIIWVATAGLGTVAILAIFGFVLSAMSARTLLTDGQHLATEGIADLGRGDFERASTKFAEAGESFARASDELDRPWALAARVVPVAAQNAATLSNLAAGAAESSTQLGISLGVIDPDTLRIVEGRINISAIEAVSAPLTDVQASLVALDANVTDSYSPWLLQPVQSRVAELAEEINANEHRLANAVNAADLAPQMLGRDGPRRYLFVFTTPAEARGLGGFMGNFAEVTAVDGLIMVERFGRTGELNAGGLDPLSRVVSGPEEWLDQWGRYGFVGGPGGTTSAVPWSNITMSPHFPSTAQVIAELYPQSGGAPIDGVFAMDPYVLVALLGFTGPVQIEATNQELNADNALDFLLTGQYLIDDTPDRTDLLEQVSEVTINRLLEGDLPNPVDLAATLGPLAAEGRFVGWSANPDEEALFEAVRFWGGLPHLEGGDGVAVVINNAAANKIDTYLERELEYDATVDPVSGQVTGTLRVTLTNTAPASGLPEVVIGNLVGQPRGTNRFLLSMYTALPVLAATRDGEPVTIEPGREEEWNTARMRVTVPAGESTTITLQVGGRLTLIDGYQLVTRPQPMVLPERQLIRVSSDAGYDVVVMDGLATSPQRFELG